jgi:hypothetical protein
MRYDLTVSSGVLSSLYRWTDAGPNREVMNGAANRRSIARPTERYGPNTTAYNNATASARTHVGPLMNIGRQLGQGCRMRWRAERT